jgi:hypothetical protein
MKTAAEAILSTYRTFHTQENDVSRDSMQSLMEKWMSDPQFRAKMRNDPQAAIQDGGFNLTDDEVAQVSALSDPTSSQALEERVSKVKITP